LVLGSIFIALSRGGEAPLKIMQFSDRNCKALNINTFMKIVRKRNGNSVKKTDATIPSPCQISGQQGFDVYFGEHGLRIACSQHDYPNQILVVCTEIRVLHE